MARETAADRKLREANEQAYEEAQRAAAYFPRLMATLESATKYPNNYELTVKEGKFYLVDRDTRDDYRLSPAYDRNEWALDSLETAMSVAEEERKEAKRLDDFARAAFNKLTKEEQQALGLNSRYNW